MIGLLYSVVLLFFMLLPGPGAQYDWFPPGEVVYGVFSQYGELPTVATVEYRREHNQIPSGFLQGYIAVADCGRVGETAWISLEYDSWLRVGVMDCSGSAQTTAWMNDNNIIGEIDYYLAVKYDTIGKGISGRMIFSD